MPKGLGIVKLPRLMSESLLIWDKIKINIQKARFGKFRIKTI